MRVLYDSEHARHARSDSIVRNKECRSDHPQNATTSIQLVFGLLMSVRHGNDSTGTKDLNRSTTTPDVFAKIPLGCCARFPTQIFGTESKDCRSCEVNNACLSRASHISQQKGLHHQLSSHHEDRCLRHSPRHCQCLLHQQG